MGVMRPQGRTVERELAPPLTNRVAGGRRVDCRWPERRLTLELDGYRYHHYRHAWEQDRCREREARALGDDFRRYSYGDVVEAPGPMLRELQAVLRPAGSGGLGPGPRRAAA
jgi:very-short-patch-repair endonuclease